jgi:2-polyprenyl-3-methyl-5-hydroxy-6-metoxy-1,4-benzoquinol methylase
VDPATEDTVTGRSVRIGILVIARNASGTLAGVLERIPASVRSRVAAVLVCDDNSDDETYLVGLGYRQVAPDLPLTILKSEGAGYGGNQKVGVRWAIEHDLDVLALLHADGQYAPESLPDVVGPLERDECDVVLGSRMLEPGAARRGGMPLYKLVGNRVLSAAQNALVGTDFSEWHSGYRAYRVSALRAVPFERNADGYEFDVQLLIQLREAGMRIREVPVPTYYGSEIRHFKGVAYAKRVLDAAARYRLDRMGFGSGELAFAQAAYELKDEPDSSHGRIIAWLRERPPSRVLDLGCSDGALGARLQELGHEVTGVDSIEHARARTDLHALVIADLEHGVPREVGDGYDVVIAADVLEHLRAPEQILDDVRGRLREGGTIVVSVPNFGHWYPRLRVGLGTFDYDRRGILDRSHLRFFTRRSFERLVHERGYAVTRRETVGLPFEVTARGDDGRATDEGRDDRDAFSLLRRVEDAALAIRPTLFAYQFLYELRPDSPTEDPHHLRAN